jgi:hypothetical protein
MFKQCIYKGWIFAISGYRQFVQLRQKMQKYNINRLVYTMSDLALPKVFRTCEYVQRIKLDNFVSVQVVIYADYYYHASTNATANR